MSKFIVCSFYRFHNIPQESLTQIEKDLTNEAKKHEILGLVIMGTEGINTTFAGTRENVDKMKTFFESFEGFSELSYKEAEADIIPFRRFKVQTRKEIVTLDRPDISNPNEQDDSHLSPAEWHKVLTEEEDYLLIDTRNWYESEIGKFKNAIAPDINEFTEFPKWLEKQEIPKDKKVLIYCTGGIRCEKAQVDMKEKGFKNVFQLKDGILRYMEEFPHQEFDGECFIFDHRVAVNQDLKATTVYDLCPHCGQPAKEEISCVKCDDTAKVCHRCLEKEKKFHTCSKNCAHHYTLNPNKKIRKHTNSVTNYRKDKKVSFQNTK